MIIISPNRVKPNGRVVIWDLGPQTEPAAPAAPPEPDKGLKGAELAAAQVEHEDAVVLYRDSLRRYTAARNAYREWKATKGGPVKIEQWAVDAGHSVNVEPDRYKLDLPKGLQPGRAQIEADEEAKKEREEYERAASNDPQFGKQATGVAA